MASPAASIFVSHPHSDELLAKELRKIIADVFGAAVAVFVSSDIANLPAGAAWREEIKKQLSHSKLLIVLLSWTGIGCTSRSVEPGHSIVQ